MKTRHFPICGWFLLALVAFAPALFAQQMNYQGRLTDASGNPLQDGQYTITFDLYDGPVNGAKVWGPFAYDGGSGNGHGAKVDLVNGRFNVILGPNDTTSRPLSGAFGGALVRFAARIEQDRDRDQRDGKEKSRHRDARLQGAVGVRRPHEDGDADEQDADDAGHARDHRADQRGHERLVFGL